MILAREFTEKKMFSSVKNMNCQQLLKNSQCVYSFIGRKKGGSTGSFIMMDKMKGLRVETFVLL